MKKKILLTLFGLITVVFCIPVFAANPHFIKGSASVEPNGALEVSFKEAGLGDTVQVNYVLTATGEAVYACMTKSGNHPQAENKVGPGTLTGGGTLTSNKNGSITGEFTVGPPAPTLSCPNGQTRELACVKYTNVLLTDTTFGPTLSFAGPFSINFNVKGVTQCPL